MILHLDRTTDLRLLWRGREGEAMHTLGPWIYERIGATHRNQREKSMAFRITAPNGNGPKRWEIAVGYYKPEWAEAEANARLIAAAPALAEALLTVVREAHGQDFRATGGGKVYAIPGYAIAEAEAALRAAGGTL